MVLWFTGLSGAGKTTLATRVETLLRQKGYRTFFLDGDRVRRGLCSDLGFSATDRHENLRRVGEVCRMFADAGVIVLAAFVSPFRDDRRMAREIVGLDDFVEVYCDAHLSVCEQRDVKGLYVRARRGDIADFTGISSPYEAPENAEVVVHSGTDSIEQCTGKIVNYLLERNKQKRVGGDTQ